MQNALEDECEAPAEALCAANEFARHDRAHDLIGAFENLMDS
jgi:hypothetical protein